jgi:hypothetical protein
VPYEIFFDPALFEEEYKLLYRQHQSIKVKGFTTEGGSKWRAYYFGTRTRIKKILYEFFFEWEQTPPQSPTY